MDYMLSRLLQTHLPWDLYSGGLSCFYKTVETTPMEEFERELKYIGEGKGTFRYIYHYKKMSETNFADKVRNLFSESHKGMKKKDVPYVEISFYVKEMPDEILTALLDYINNNCTSRGKIVAAYKTSKNVRQIGYYVPLKDLKYPDSYCEGMKDLIVSRQKINPQRRVLRVIVCRTEPEKGNTVPMSAAINIRFCFGGIIAYKYNDLTKSNEEMMSVLKKFLDGNSAHKTDETVEDASSENPQKDSGEGSEEKVQKEKFPVFSNIGMSFDKILADKDKEENVSEETEVPYIPFKDTEEQSKAQQAKSPEESAVEEEEQTVESQQKEKEQEFAEESSLYLDIVKKFNYHDFMSNVYNYDDIVKKAVVDIFSEVKEYYLDRDDDRDNGIVINITLKKSLSYKMLDSFVREISNDDIKIKVDDNKDFHLIVKVV